MLSTVLRGLLTGIAMHSMRLLALGAMLAALPAPAAAEPSAALAALPSFRELEAAGARIGQIIIRNEDVFDTTDPEEDNALFRAANLIHIQTREGVIRRALLFNSGEPLSAALIEETERSLRSARFLYDVRLRPIAVRDNVVDIEVMTRDSWSLDLGLSFGRSGGSSSSNYGFSEYNLLGTGTALSFARTSDVDRDGREFSVSNDRLFGNWISVGYRQSVNDDGRSEGASVLRPFYSLDARWSAGASWSRNDRVESIYNGGEVVSRYRQDETRAEFFAGFSRGRVDGTVQRHAVGLRQVEQRYALQPGAVAPQQLPADETQVMPFYRYELIEDRYERLFNRDQLGRPEFFPLGWNAVIDIGRAATTLGSTRNEWVLSANARRGFTLGSRQTLMTSAYLTGRYANGGADRVQTGFGAQYYLPQSSRWLFYASAAADTLVSPGPTDMLLLGGDNGLRGYPLRYQAGNHRALITLEERLYTDIFLWRLFRLGAAAYIDVGRAWGGPHVNLNDPGWLANAGLGLRIFSVRSAFSNVLHVDVAMPISPVADVKRVQYLLKTRTSF
jgi:outer membrane protein assembly factor BamA